MQEIHLKENEIIMSVCYLFETYLKYSKVVFPFRRILELFSGFFLISLLKFQLLGEAVFGEYGELMWCLI